MQSDRDAFLAAIAADPCDCCLRAVYADWLEENGLDPDETAQQRRWKEIMAESEAWLRDLAGRMDGSGEDGSAWYGPYKPMTYEWLMKAAGRWIDTDDGNYGGDYLVQHGSESWRNMFCDDALVAEFWKHYEIVTGKKPKTANSFFSCSC